jgi:predicted DNA-binding transcriptional regulator AlpA/predicted GIY-YIG superfamily endonuclease
MTVRKADIALPPRLTAYVTREEGAAELRISPSTWDEMVDSGQIPKPIRLGRMGTILRWRWADIDPAKFRHDNAPAPSLPARRPPKRAVIANDTVANQSRLEQSIAELGEELEEYVASDDFLLESMHATSLYRHFDREGRLLYVGISMNVFARLAQHRRESHWYSQITRVEIEHFDSREEVLAAEGEAIRGEKPLHDVVGADAMTIRPYSDSLQ